MPPKKNSKSAIYYFVKEKLDKGIVRGSFRDALEEVNPLWKSMTKEEKEPYERMYKEFKESLKTANAQIASTNLKCEYHSEINGINNRSDDMRRELENYVSKLVQDQLKVKGSTTAIDVIKKQKWYIVKFQTFCKCDDNPFEDIYRFSSKHYYVLAEVGAIEYSIEHGITNEFHAFITPNQIPLGYRSLCMESTRDVHRIPLDNFDQPRHSIPEVYAKLDEFLKPTIDNNYFVPVFCMSKDVEETSFAFEFIKFKSERHNARPLCLKVFDLEFLVVQFTNTVDKTISYNSARELLNSSDYDWSSLCKYHEEIHVKHCAIGAAKKACHLISDQLCLTFKVEVTKNHLPVGKFSGTVIYNDEFSLHKDNRKTFQYGKRPRDNQDDENGKIYTTIKRSSNSSNMITVDNSHQQQQQHNSTSKTGSTSKSETDSLEVSSKINKNDDDEDWTVLDKNNKTSNNTKSVISTSSNLSKPTSKTMPPTRFMGRGRGFIRN